MTLLNNYRRQPVTFVRGKGAWLEDDAGNQYLDFTAGIGVNALGHGHPRVVAAIARQARELIHVSNLYHSPPVSALAARLCSLSGMQAAFFCNSGTEAVEAAIKLVRKHWSRSADGQRKTVLYASGSFHGRTYGALAATDNARYRQGFDPLPPAFERIGFNDDSGVVRIGEDIAAVIVEPVQGESGVHAAQPDWLRALRARCDDVGSILILDETQCGLGRTGSLFAFQSLNVVPDALTIAKPLGGGLPLGALLVGEKLVDTFVPGDHGSTFGGNPVACAAGIALLDEFEETDLLATVGARGSFLAGCLRMLALRYCEVLGEVRSYGLMIAVDVRDPYSAENIQAVALRHRVLLTTAGANTLRLLPPLIISDADINNGVRRLANVFEEVAATTKPLGSKQAAERA